MRREPHRTDRGVRERRARGRAVRVRTRRLGSARRRHDGPTFCARTAPRHMPRPRRGHLFEARDLRRPHRTRGAPARVEFEREERRAESARARRALASRGRAPPATGADASILRCAVVAGRAARGLLRRVLTALIAGVSHEATGGNAPSRAVQAARPRPRYARRPRCARMLCGRGPTGCSGTRRTGSRANTSPLWLHALDGARVCVVACSVHHRRRRRRRRRSSHLRQGCAPAATPRRWCEREVRERTGARARFRFARVFRVTRCVPRVCALWLHALDGARACVVACGVHHTVVSATTTRFARAARVRARCSSCERGHRRARATPVRACVSRDQVPRACVTDGSPLGDVRPRREMTAAPTMRFLVSHF